MFCTIVIAVVTSSISHDFYTVFFISLSQYFTCFEKYIRVEICQTCTLEYCVCYFRFWVTPRTYSYV